MKQIFSSFRIIFGFLFFWGLLQSHNALAQSRESARANADRRSHKLNPDEVIVHRSPKPVSNFSSEKTSKIFINGQPVDIQKNEPISGVSGNPKVSIFVDSQNLSTKIYGPSNQPLSPGQKIHSSVLDQIQKHGNARVIIRTHLPGFYYDLNQSLSERSARQNDFRIMKDSLSVIMKGQSKITKDLQIINGFAATVDLETLKALQKLPEVVEISIDGIVHASLDTSTQQVNATAVWSMTDATSQSILGYNTRIAIIDTGVDYLHPDLGGCFGASCKVMGGYDFVNNDADPMDDHGHGTHVAATAAGIGPYPGVASGAKILAYKVLDQDGYGYDSVIIQGIQAAVDPNGDGNPSDHVDIISMSIGGPGYAWDDMSQAVDNATGVGVISVVAAGNSGPYGSIESPGTAATAITVAAACKPDQVGVNTDCANQIASFSSIGPVYSMQGTDLFKPDIAAPGVLICAARHGNSFSDAPTCLDTHHVRISGTSMATPHVAGVIALLKQSQPWLTPSEIKQTLKSSATTYNLDINRQGSGLIDAEAATLSSGLFIPVLNIQPNYWAIGSDPTHRISTSTASFNVTGVSLTNSPKLTAELSSPVTGVTLTAPIIRPVNGSATVLDVTVAIDNDVALSGVYSRDILLKDKNLILKGSIHININVVPTLSVNKTLVDYGYDDPSASTWTSSPQTIQVTNLRTDISQTIQTSLIDYPLGVSVNAASNVNIGPGNSANIDTRLNANNSQFADGTYMGSVRFASGSNVIVNVASTFSKAYALVVASDTQIPTGILIYDLANESHYLVPDKLNSVFFVNHPGTYDVITLYSQIDQTPTFVVKEHQSVIGGSANTVNVSKADAIYELTNTMTASNGTKYYPDESYSLVTTNGVGIFSSNYYYPIQKFSPMSTNYIVERSYDPYLFKENVNLFYDRSEGISAHKTYTNLSTDLVGPTVQTRFNMTDQSNQVDMLVQTITPVGFIEHINSNKAPALNIKSLYPNTWTNQNQYDRGVISLRSNADRNRCPGTGACNKIFETPLFYPNDASLDQYYFPYYYQYPDINPRPQGTMTVGQGPLVWFGQFENQPNEIIINDFGNLGIVFKRQDYSIGEYDDVPYNIYDSTNVNIIGSGVISGYHHGIEESDSFVGYPTILDSSVYPLSNPGKYGFSATVPYSINSTKYEAVASASFRTNISDPNPPSLRKLYVFDNNNNRAETLNKNKTSRIEFEIDPVGGTLDPLQTTLSYLYSADAKGTVTLSSWDSTFGKTFSGTIPANATATKVTITIKTRDLANNIFSYKFELPLQ